MTEKAPSPSYLIGSCLSGLNRHVFGVSTHRLVQLQLEVHRPGVVDQYIARVGNDGSRRDVLNAASLEGARRSMDWMSVIIGIESKTTLLAHVQESIARWYGWERPRRRFTFHQLILKSIGSDGLPCDFSDPALGSAWAYLHLLFFCCANITKRLDGDKALTYSAPKFADDVLVVISATFSPDAPMPPSEPEQWPIVGVADLDRKLAVIDQERSGRPVLLVLSTDNRDEMETLLAQPRWTDLTRRLVVRYVSVFMDLIHALGMTRIDARTPRFYPAADRCSRLVTEYGPAGEIRADLLSRAHGTSGSVRGLDVLSFSDALTELRRDKKDRIILWGEGGIGKTTAMLDLLVRIQRTPEPPELIPFFLDLGKIQTRTHQGEGNNWILGELAELYAPREWGDVNHRIDRLASFFFRPAPEDGPEYVLLLDGYNEISDTACLSTVQTAIRDLTERATNAAVVIAARRDEQQYSSYLFREYVSVQLCGVPDRHDATFLSDNPLYLSLLEESSHSFDHVRSAGYPLLEPAERKAEVLCNFLVVSRYRFDVRNPLERDRWRRDLVVLTLDHLAPDLGYILERNGRTGIPRREVQALIAHGIARLELTIVRTSGRIDADSELVSQIIDTIFIRELSLLRESDTGDLRFRHTELRDYFSACHILREMEEALTQERPAIDCLRERVLPARIVRLAGERAGEHKRYPSAPETVPGKTLDLLRGETICPGDWRLYNVIEILKQVRRDLTGTNLSDLDLRHIRLAGAVLGHSRTRHLDRAANLHRVRVSPRTFSLNQPLEQTVAIRAGETGSAFFTMSDTGVVAEWDLETLTVRSTYFDKTDGDAGNVIRRLINEGRKDGFDCLQVSHDGARVAVQTSGGTIHVLNAADARFDDVPREPEQFCFNRKGDKIIAAKSRGVQSCRVWGIDGRTVDSEVTDRCERELRHEEVLAVAAGFDSRDKPLVARVTRAGRSDPNDVSARLRLVVHVHYPAGDTVFPEIESEGREVHAFRISGDGKRALLVCDQSVSVWDLASGDLLIQLEPADVPGVDLGEPGSVLISHDGSRMSCAGGGSIRTWSVDDGLLLSVIDEPIPREGAMSFAAAGQLFLVGSRDGIIRVYEVLTGLLKAESQPSYVGGFQDVVVGADSDTSELIAFGAPDGSLTLWDGMLTRCIHALPLTNTPIRQVLLNDGGLQLVVISESDHTIRTVEIATREVHAYSRSEIDRPVTATAIAALADKRSFFCGYSDGTVGHVAPDSHGVLSLSLVPIDSLAGIPIVSLEFFDTGSRLLVLTTDNAFHVINTESLSVEQSVGSSAARISIARVVPGEIRVLAVDAWRQCFTECDLLSGQQRIYHTIDDAVDDENGPALNRSISAFAVSPDGTAVAAGREDGTIAIYNLDGFRRVSREAVHSSPVRAIRWCGPADSKNALVVSIEERGGALLWDTRSGKVIREVPVRPGLFLVGIDVEGMQFEPVLEEDEKRILKMYSGDVQRGYQ